MLEVLKILLGIETDDYGRDNILNYYLQQARLMAEGYCNVLELPERYDSTIINLALYLYRNQDVLGYSQKTEGERSVGFCSSDIPDFIKSALPQPRILIGGA